MCNHSQQHRTPVDSDTDSMGLPALCAVLCGIIVGLYQLVKWNVTKSSLDNLPGPPSHSFITGTVFV